VIRTNPSETDQCRFCIASDTTSKPGEDPFAGQRTKEDDPFAGQKLDGVAGSDDMALPAGDSAAASLDKAARRTSREWGMYSCVTYLPSPMMTDLVVQMHQRSPLHSSRSEKEVSTRHPAREMAMPMIRPGTRHIMMR
jgi:hypothetical protein